MEDQSQISVCLLTVSDTCFSGVAEDMSGRALRKMIEEGSIPGAKVGECACVPDEYEDIVSTLLVWVKQGVSLILTTGGTGLAPRDGTPEAVKAVIQKKATGLSQLMIAKSLQVTPMAALSRPVCGTRDRTLIITLPGSMKASTECLSYLAPVLPHALDLLADQKLKVSQVHEAIQAERPHLHKATNCDHVSKSSPHLNCVQQKQSTGVCGRHRKSPFEMISVDDALQKMFVVAKEKEEVLDKLLKDALGYSLAENVEAETPLPPFRASIKDGYAVLFSDGAGKRKMVGCVRAGDCVGLQQEKDAKIDRLKPGTCIRINTGAPVPFGADAVVMVENTLLLESVEGVDGTEEAEIEILRAPSNVGDEIRPVGSDIELGEVVLKKYDEVGPAEVGVAAAVGRNSLRVVAKPCVGIFSTGNEIKAPGSGPLEPGQIYDSNGPMLSAIIRGEGVPFVCGASAGDTADQMRRAIMDLLDHDVDIIVTSGSVSMGEADLLRPVLTHHFKATVHFAQVNLKPGKPTTFASFEHKLKRRLVLALPGNPASTFVTAHIFLLPLIRHMSRLPTLRTLVNAQLESSFSLGDRPEYLRCSLITSPNGGLPIVHAMGMQQSSRVTSCRGATGLAILPIGGKAKQGDQVKVLLLD